MISIITKACSRESDGSHEEAASLKLQSWFEKELSAYSDLNGTIYILHSIRLFGQQRDDIDILVIGFFENFVLDNVYTKDHGTVDKLNIQSFISNIEIKSQPHDKIRVVGSEYLVKYKNKNLPSSISAQCREAKFSLVNHLHDQLGLKSHICDILWLDNLTEEQLTKKRQQTDNALPLSFTFSRFIDTLLLQSNVYTKNDKYFLNTFNDGKGRMEDVIDLFTKEREPKGLTKQKFEILSQQSTEIDEISKSIGNKLTILTGRAGTGKTMQLLQLAFKLASNENSNRCLILTYNNALVSDIKRLIDYTPMPTKVNGRTVSIQTIHSFFHNIFEDFGITVGRLSPQQANYDKLYQLYHEQLHHKLELLCNQHGVQAIKDLPEPPIDWDYILIDEAQDFSDYEKLNLFKLYSPNRMVIADGVDQFVRNAIRQEWDKDISLIEKPSTMTLERRQKVSLVRFINAFAKRVNLDWYVTENDTLTGGVIRIIPKFKGKTYNELRKNCKESGCEKYDILLLQPPTQVTIDSDGNRYFAKAKDYTDAGIPIFDGIDTRKRNTYPTKDQCRVYQYDSCRGLEGWCVVCADFDELISYKYNTYKNGYYDLGFDPETNRKRYTYLWSLIPLTRAVDTLIITLKDPNSEIGVILKEIADKHSDYVIWEIE